MGMGTKGLAARVVALALAAGAPGDARCVGSSDVGGSEGDAPWVLAERGTTPAAASSPQEAPGKGGETGKEGDGPEAGPGAGGEKSAASSLGARNLAIPGDLPEPARQALEKAIASFHAAEQARSGRDRLVNKAIQDLKSAQGKVSKSPLPGYYLGIAYQWKRNFKQAKLVLEKALKLKPDFHEAQVELADVHVWQHRVEDSLPLYDRALALEPRYFEAHERKASALMRLGRLQEAKESAEKAAKLRTTRPVVGMLLLIGKEIKGPGWDKTYTQETENYKVITPVSEEAALEVARAAELIRRAYDRVFSGIPKPDRKYEIWLYPSLAAYHEATNIRQALGHYDPLFRKLVLPWSGKKDDTLTTLHHEAFHQYLHDYLEIAPQWFNEGLGDYFGAFRYEKRLDREVMASHPAMGRLKNVQFAIARGILPPASDLMTMSREEMYDPRMGAFHYAQAWAMIYFMIEGNKPQYRGVLIAYFNALRKGKDLSEAFDLTFGKLDLERFDAEWKGFIANLGTK